MKASPRIYIPILLALGTTVLIGLLFLWRIRLSISVIESGFKGLGNTTAKMFGNPLGMQQQPDLQSQSDALTSLRQGELYELKGQWQQAQQRYEKSVESGGGTPALRKLASIQLQRREYDQVGETIRKLKKQDGESDAIMLLEGVLQLRKGDSTGAKRTFERKAQSPYSQYGLAVIAITSGDHEAAKTQLLLAAQSNDPTIRAYAQTLLDAYNEFTLFEHGQDIHLQTLLARSLAQVNECETALVLVRDVVATQDRYRDAWIVKGYCEFVTERLPEALASLERAYTIDPEKAEIQYFLARTYAATGNSSKAVTFLQYAIINGFQPEADARQLLAEYALDLGNTSLSLEQYKALYQADDSTIAAFETFVDLALRTPDQTLEAYQAAKLAQKRWPGDAKILILLGQAAAASGDRATAESSFSEALAIDPANGKAKEGLEKLSSQPPASEPARK